MRFSCPIAAAIVLILSACAGDGDRAELEKYANAERVLSAEDVAVADPGLAGQPISLPPAFRNDDWAQTGGEADHALHHVEIPATLKRQWRKRVVSRKAKGAPITAMPVVGPKHIYVIDAVAAVRALDRTSGKEVWKSVLTPDVRDPNRSRFNIFAKVNAADLGFGGGAALSGDRLYISSGFGFVAALSAENGEELWRYETTSPMRNPPTVAEGVVVAVSISNEVIALDENTGEEIWTYESFEEAARYLAAAAPAISDGSVIVPFSSGEISSLALANGRVQWQQVVARTSRLNSLSIFGDIAGSPVVDQGAIFAVSQSGQLAGVDFRTGSIAWNQPVGGFHTPWLAGETVFSLSNKNELAAINRVDGKVRWNVALPTYKNEKKRKGRIDWAGPVLASGQLLVASNQGKMIAVSPQDGSILKTWKLREGTTLSPIVANGVVYVVTTDGFLEAFSGSFETDG